MRYLLRLPMRVMRRIFRPIRYFFRKRETRCALRTLDKIHLGAGNRYLDGWANLDREGDRNLMWDLRKPLPIQPGRVRFAYSEHFIEHLTRDDGLALFRRIRSAMAPDGVMRVATPDMMMLAKDYIAGTVSGDPAADWNPKTACQMINGGVRNWGHLFMYDENELWLILREAGFSRVERVACGESRFPELRGLENKFGDLALVMEARP